MPRTKSKENAEPVSRTKTKRQTTSTAEEKRLRELYNEIMKGEKNDRKKDNNKMDS